MVEVDWVAAILVEKKYVRKRVFEYCVQLIRIYRWRWSWFHVTENVYVVLLINDYSIFEGVICALCSERAKYRVGLIEKFLSTM